MTLLEKIEVEKRKSAAHPRVKPMGLLWIFTSTNFTYVAKRLLAKNLGTGFLLGREMDSPRGLEEDPSQLLKLLLAIDPFLRKDFGGGTQSALKELAASSLAL